MRWLQRTAVVISLPAAWLSASRLSHPPSSWCLLIISTSTCSRSSSLFFLVMIFIRLHWSAIRSTLVFCRACTEHCDIQCVMERNFLAYVLLLQATNYSWLTPHLAVLSIQCCAECQQPRKVCSPRRCVARSTSSAVVVHT
jgi:hypothetical protein